MMKTSMIALFAILGLIASVAPMGPLLPASTAHAQHELPGMCNGRTDPKVGVNAHANGRTGEEPKYILNLFTDDLGAPYGTLVVGQGKGRLMVREWCRMWGGVPAPCG